MVMLSTLPTLGERPYRDITDEMLNSQEVEEEPEGEPLSSGQKALIARIVSHALITEE